jgi:hypothetical protein
MQVPWSQMKAEDIINWPSGMEVKPPKKMSINELKRLHELAKTDQLDFSSEFLRILHKGIIKGNPCVTDEFRTYIAQYLGVKLSKQLNVPSMEVPWSQMTAGDITNWPSGMEVKPPKKMNIKELKRLHELAKEDVLDFSPKFLRRITSNRTANTLYFPKLRASVANYLTQKLASGLNVDSVRLLPWSEMTEGDILNWPSDVEFRPLYKMKTKEIRRLYEFAKADRLVFSPEFLKRQLAKTKSAAPELH